MGKYALDMEQYVALARQTAAEGCVLLKNDNQTLPLRTGDRVAVFGRIASTYLQEWTWFRWSGQHQIRGRNLRCIKRRERYYDR